MEQQLEVVRAIRSVLVLVQNNEAIRALMPQGATDTTAIVISNGVAARMVAEMMGAVMPADHPMTHAFVEFAGSVMGALCHYSEIDPEMASASAERILSYISQPVEGSVQQ